MPLSSRQPLSINSLTITPCCHIVPAACQTARISSSFNVLVRDGVSPIRPEGLGPRKDYRHRNRVLPLPN